MQLPHFSWSHKPRVPFVEPPFNQLHPVNTHGSLDMLRDDEASVPIAFRRHDKSTNIELFYDLFFVANLTVFTNVHEITTSGALKQYLGFFCLIWFTWYQVTLYDTRFAMDSIFERIAKAIQLIAMMGFAACGPKFNPGQSASEAAAEFEGGVSADNAVYFSAITIFLMVSRLVLVAQYIQTALLVHTRAGKQSPRVPGIVLSLCLTALAYFVTAAVYLGLYWTFATNDPDRASQTYVVWYVMAILETIVVSALSVTYKSISFGGTHLVERMSLLTLIILGEGAIAAAKSCQAVIQANSELQRAGSAAAMMFCAVIYLYCLYLIYFNCIQREHFQGMWQQIWSHLHFPLHAALVLAVEGASQCITWRAAVARVNELPVDDWFNWLDSNNFSALAQSINSTTNQILSAEIVTTKSFATTLDAFLSLDQLNIAVLPVIEAGGDNASAYSLANDTVQYMQYKLLESVLVIAGFSPEEKKGPPSVKEIIESLGVPMTNFTGSALDETLDNFEKSYNIFYIVAIYFLVATGAVLILCAVLGGLSGGKKSRASWLQFLVTAMVGTGVAFVACIEDTDDPQTNFNTSPWVLPTAMLAVFGVVVFYTLSPIPVEEEGEEGGAEGPQMESMVLRNSDGHETKEPSQSQHSHDLSV